MPNGRTSALFFANARVHKPTAVHCSRKNSCSRSFCRWVPELEVMASVVLQQSSFFAHSCEDLDGRVTPVLCGTDGLPQVDGPVLRHLMVTSYPSSAVGMVLAEAIKHASEKKSLQLFETRSHHNSKVAMEVDRSSTTRCMHPPCAHLQLSNHCGNLGVSERTRLLRRPRYSSLLVSPSLSTCMYTSPLHSAQMTSMSQTHQRTGVGSRLPRNRLPLGNEKKNRLSGARHHGRQQLLSAWTERAEPRSRLMSR